LGGFPEYMGKPFNVYIQTGGLRLNNQKYFSQLF